MYNPETGVFTQYAHLVHRGSLVELGESVESGQPIGLSGNTGQSTEEHLHFSCMVAVNTEDGLKSVPFEFTGGLKSVDLKKGDELKRAIVVKIHD